MNTIFQKIINDFKNEFNQSFQNNPFQQKKASPAKSIIIPLIVVAIVGIVGEYIILEPINLRSPGFVIHLAMMIFVFTVLHSIILGAFDKLSKAGLTVGICLFAYVGIGNIISMPVFHAKEYQTQLSLDKKADFFTDNETISYQSIPVVDRESAIKLGDRKMGQMIDYVSQFEVNSMYNQINYQDTPYRVTPLEYSDLVKWFTNRSKGLPAYIKVNMVTQDSEIVELKDGMKYSESEHFGRNIYRYLRMRYPTAMFEELSFEIDEEGVPYYVAPTYTYKVGIFGGKDITGAVLVNAVNGEHQYYTIDKVPQWVDRAYPADLVVAQLENYGKYVNGYINSIISQKGVLQPTEGYNYIAIDDDVYLYTGLTSVSSDASNVGFALINLRTKEGKYYNISGAEEYSAMSSAEGKVQHLGYSATFPILVNAGGEPTYFLSLKDDSNLVKMYAFVSVKNYQIVATGTSVSEAEKAYYDTLAKNGKTTIDSSKKQTVSGVISQINSAVKEGNSYYYLKLEGNDQIYVADISLSDELPLMSPGAEIEVSFIANEGKTVVVSEISTK